MICFKPLAVAGCFALGLFATTTSAQITGSPCNHCPPEPTISGVPQPTDDVLMGNGVNWAEASAANGKAVMEYDGWDPAARAAQFIRWFAGVMGPNVEGNSQLADAAVQDKPAQAGELVLAVGNDKLFGKHRVVVPIRKPGFIMNGQLAYVETQKGRLPLRVSTPAAPVKGYGGYVLLTGYDMAGERVTFALPSGDKDLEWVYPLVRLSGKKADAKTAVLYSEKGRGVSKK